MSTTKYEIQEFIGDIEDHDLETYNIFEDMFSTLSYDRDRNTDADAVKSQINVCFAHSLWLPRRYSTRYGHAVNTYVSGHVGSFEEGSYFPMDKNKEKRRKENSQQNMAVDRWVMRETDGKVPKLFGTSLSHNVSSMLLGVVSFKMPWRYAFSAPTPMERPSIRQFPIGWFRVGENHRIRCRYMTTHKGVGLSYITSKDALVVNVPFASGLAAMIAIPRHKKRRQELRERRRSTRQQRDDTDSRSGKKDDHENSEMFRNLYDPPSLEHILHGNKESEPKSLNDVLDRMAMNRSRGKVVDRLTLPMGTIEWTGNIKHAVKKRFFISELFAEEEAELGSAIGDPDEHAHVSGMIQRNSLELIPDGIINGGMSDRSAMTREASSKGDDEKKKKRHMQVDSPFLIVIHHRGQSVMMGYIHGVKSPDVDARVEKCASEALKDPWRGIKAKISTDTYDEPMDDSDDDSDLAIYH